MQQNVKYRIENTNQKFIISPPCSDRPPAGLLKNTTNHWLDRFDKPLPPALSDFWQRAARLALDHGWELYLVGGAVRDLLRSASNSVGVVDLDLVVSAAPLPPEGAAMILATELQAQFYPQGQLTCHGTFQTATLELFPGGPGVDLATARLETYAYPGSHPTVRVGSIYQDLQRRDFTINAMALRLTPPDAGELVDFFHGQADLAAGCLRVLHDRSFADDPTRLFRGVRFLTRMGLRWDEGSIAQWYEALDAGVWQQALAQGQKVPSVQARLTAELKYLLTSPQWLLGILALQEVRGWQCLHPALGVAPATLERLAGLEKLDWQEVLPPRWLLRLEVVLMGLDPIDRASVATQLQLPPDSSQRLGQVELVASLDLGGARPSVVCQTLEPYGVDLLALAYICHPQLGEIDRYLREWRGVKAPLTGTDLRSLGYTPGPQYRSILGALLAATRDGEVIDRPTAIAFVRHNYS
jgi:tRNA nucleotidyltransferase (CCA-adding enzyme)